MRRWAPIILLGIGALLFLVIMPSEEGSWAPRGVFLQMAPQLLFVQSLFVLWLMKHRRQAPVAKYGWFGLMFVLAIVRMTGAFHAEIFALGPKTGGRLIFALVAMDVVLGYYIPWRSSERTRDADVGKL